jgi:hypothetical protein
MAPQAEIIFIRIFKTMIGQADWYAFVVTMGETNLVGFFIERDKFAYAMTGLASDPQVRGVNFATFVMKGMASEALGAFFRLVRGAGYVHMAGNAPKEPMTAFTNLLGVYLQGNLVLVNGFDAGFFLVAFQAERLGSKGAGVGLDIGKAMAIQAIPLLSLKQGGHHGIRCIGLPSPNRNTQKRDQTEDQAHNQINEPLNYSFSHVIPSMFSNSPGCSCIIFSRVVRPVKMVFSTGNTSGLKWVVTI